jgi:hypothetical protein
MTTYTAASAECETCGSRNTRLTNTPGVLRCDAGHYFEAEIPVTSKQRRQRFDDDE